MGRHVCKSGKDLLVRFEIIESADFGALVLSAGRTSGLRKIAAAFHIT